MWDSPEPAHHQSSYRPIVEGLWVTHVFVIRDNKGGCGRNLMKVHVHSLPDRGFLHMAHSQLSSQMLFIVNVMHT
jgi:hypothetical protein